MTTTSRRLFLTRSAALGCSLAASPLITPVSFAAAPWDNRLVVIILRGGMDGLDTLRPFGDPDFAALRPALAGGERGVELASGFTLHPGLADLLPLWQVGELGFVNAVSTPYRSKRSHFDGQDILEAGTDDIGGGVRDGWLNRMLQHVPGVTTETAYAIGHNDMKLMSGAAPVANWAPDSEMRLSPQAMRLAELVMEADPQMHAALAEAMMLSETPEEAMMGGGKVKGAHNEIAKFAGERLRGDARVAAFSLNGWDTHRNQNRSLGRALGQLSQTLLTLRDTMGAGVWGKTAVVVMTEFGRTARENGTQGTDHGTGGLMVMAGGAIRGGQIHGTWPGLSEADLFERRDLMPTRDVRAPAAWIMQALTGLDRATLENVVFPGMEMGSDPKLML
ncbi:MAG: DUF1501 domain-containing protein [Sulfitobacter sp.]